MGFYFKYLDSIVMVIEELAPSESVHDRVILVLDDVVGGNGRQI